MVPLSHLTPSTIPDLSAVVRQTMQPGTPYQSRSRKEYYSVARGHLRTIVASWEECEILIRGHHHPSYQGFMTFREAMEFMEN